MTNFQQYALSHPLSRAAGGHQEDFWRMVVPWSIILTVNK